MTDSLPTLDVSATVLQLDGDAVLLDVREPAEWDAGHAPGARHLPVGSVVAGLESIPRDVPVLVVCRSGHRSAMVTEYLCANGFDAWNVDGGMQAWAAAGQPVVVGDGTAGFVA